MSICINRLSVFWPGRSVERAAFINSLYMFRGRLWLLPTKANLSLVFALWKKVTTQVKWFLQCFLLHRYERMTGDCFGNWIQNVTVLLSCCRKVASYSGKVFCPLYCAETSWYFQANFDHSNILFGQVVWKWNIYVMKESKHSGLMLTETYE